jgi:hypothetical protein
LVYTVAAVAAEIFEQHVKIVYCKMWCKICEKLLNRLPPYLKITLLFFFLLIFYASYHIYSMNVFISLLRNIAGTLLR